MPFRVKYMLESILKYKRAYRNYLCVAYHIVRRKYPFLVVKHDDSKTQIYGINQLFLEMRGIKDYNYDLITKILSIEYKGTKLYFKGTENNGDLLGIFFSEDYKLLDVKDKTIIDIGANIGDSTTYFCISGAKKIIAVEPFKNSFELLKENLILNNCSKSVIALMAGIGSKDTLFEVSYLQKGTTQDMLKNSTKTEDNYEVPVYTLKSLFRRFDVPNLVLKIDCEGCEYEALLNLTEYELRKIESYIIEYHYGSEEICAKLTKAGFHVKDMPSQTVYNWNSKSVMKTGLIFATKQS